MGPTPSLWIPLYYDFASSLCYVTHRVLERMAGDLSALKIQFEWKPVDLTRLAGWQRGAPVPPNRAINVARVSRELEVPLHMPPTWLDSRDAAAVAIALGPGAREISWRERVWSAVYQEERFDDLASAATSLLPDLGWTLSDEALARGGEQLEQMTREAHEQMVTGVPTFLLESWPFGGIQNEDTMRSILTRFARKQRKRLQEVLH